jgi:hypothetical protein
VFRILALEVALGSAIVACVMLWFVWSARQARVLRTDWEDIRKARKALIASAINSFESIHPEEIMVRSSDPTQYVKISVPVGSRTTEDGKVVSVYAQAKVPAGISSTDIARLSNAIAGLAGADDDE